MKLFLQFFWNHFSGLMVSDCRLLMLYWYCLDQSHPSFDTLLQSFLFKLLKTIWNHFILRTLNITWFLQIFSKLNEGITSIFYIPTEIELVFKPLNHLKSFHIQKFKYHEIWLLLEIFFDIDEGITLSKFPQNLTLSSLVNFPP